MDISLILAFFTVFLFGLRHGLDTDHIAAIFSLTSAAQHQLQKEQQNNKVTLFNNAFSYIFGHAFIVIVLGLLIILIGLQLPHTLDTIFERIIGVSLIVLGIYVLCGVIINRIKKQRTMPATRFELLHRILVHVYPKTKNKNILSNISHISTDISPFLLGIIHGIGAETPSQLLLLIIVGGLQGSYAIIALLLFLIGLLISNTLLSLASIKIYSFSNTEKYITLIAAASGAFSLVIGVMVFF